MVYDASVEAASSCAGIGEHSMQVTSEQLNPCKVELKIEIEPEKVAQAYDRVYKAFAKVTKIPGFRPGKAPRAIVEKYVDESSVRREVADELISKAYPQAVSQEKLEPYAAPDVDVEELEEGKPAVFKAVVQLPPKVELGEYKGIEATKPKVEVTDEDVNAELEYMQNQRATAEKVEGRGVQENDIAIAEISSAPEGQEMSEPKRSLVQVGQNVPGFDEQIIGMMPDESKSFEVKYPDDYEDKELAGKNVKFDIKVESLRERKVPELNDEFAKSFGGGIETVDQLREDIKMHLQQAREDAAERDVERSIVDQIVEKSEVCVPDVLVDHEVGHDLQDMQQSLSRQNVTLSQYLQSVGKDQEEFLKELRESAEQRIKAGLVMGEISDKEGIDVTDEDVEAEIERMAEASGTTKEAVEAYIGTRGGRESLKNTMLNRKILDYLKSVSSIKTE